MDKQIDEYAPWGTKTIGGTAPIEDPSKWHPVMVAEAALLKRYGVTAEAFRTWPARYGFPAPHRDARRIVAGEWSLQVVREWREDAVLEWERSIRSLATKLPAHSK